ncbi:hypothetical protein [Niabella aquatica]
MKYVSLFVLILSLNISASSQEELVFNDSTYIIGIINKKVEAKVSGSYYLTKTLYSGTNVLVSGRVTGPGGGYEVIYMDKKYIIPPDGLNTNYKDLYRLLSNAEGKELNLLDSVANAMSGIASQYEIKKALEYVDKLRPRGLAIIDYRAYDESEYTGGTGFRVKVLNLSKKTIKYVTFNITGRNAVDDAVSTKTRRGIGPIKPDETGSYEFEYVWFTDIVEYIKINSITLQYLDGTSKVVTGVDKIVLPDRIVDVLQSND